MTSLPPASAIISAAISPVWAPDALGWQSCPPIISGDPLAAAAAAEISVAGGADGDIAGHARGDARP